MRRYSTPMRSISGFIRTDENKHQRLGKKENQQRDDKGKDDRYKKCAAYSPAYAISFPRPEILGDKSGKSIPEFLNGHIGERVDLDCRGECCHDSRAKTIYQPLHHQYAEVHHRLLDASQCGEGSDFFQAGTVEAHILPVQPQFGTFLVSI